MIKAVIFDMDGVLVDSEPFWRRSMIKGFNEAGLAFTEEDCRKTTGLRIDEVIDHWHRLHPWPHKSKKQVEDDVLSHLCQLLDEHAAALPGVEESLQLFSSLSYKVGLATSSPHRIINSIMKRLNIRENFQSIVSAEELQFGKPHPQVYLHCAQLLGIAPEHCLAIEDSVNGVIAAKAARMKVIAVPEPEYIHNPKFSIADITLSSLQELDEAILRKHFH